MSLLLESAACESLQKLFASICGRIGFRVCRCDIRNRLVYSFVYGGCQKGVGLALMRPAENRRHSHDLSALVDLVSHGGEEVGVQGASYHLALVVDAAGYGGMISQSAEVFDCAVLPKSGREG